MTYKLPLVTETLPFPQLMTRARMRTHTAYRKPFTRPGDYRSYDCKSSSQFARREDVPGTPAGRESRSCTPLNRRFGSVKRRS